MKHVARFIVGAGVMLLILAHIAVLSFLYWYLGPQTSNAIGMGMVVMVVMYFVGTLLV